MIYPNDSKSPPPPPPYFLLPPIFIGVFLLQTHLAQRIYSTFFTDQPFTLFHLNFPFHFGSRINIGDTSQWLVVVANEQCVRRSATDQRDGLEPLSSLGFSPLHASTSLARQRWETPSMAQTHNIDFSIFSFPLICFQITLKVATRIHVVRKQPKIETATRSVQSSDWAEPNSFASLERPILIIRT